MFKNTMVKAGSMTGKDRLLSTLYGKTIHFTFTKRHLNPISTVNTMINSDYFLVQCYELIHLFENSH